MIYILQDRIKYFNKLGRICQCQGILSFGVKDINDYRIGGRSDLLYKLLSESKFESYDSIDECVNNIISHIKNNLRQSTCTVIDKELRDCPKYLWTQLYERYYTWDSTYIDFDNNILDMGNGPRIIDDDDSESDDELTVYLYLDEPEPDPIYQVIIGNQPYCILCDKPASNADRKAVLKLGFVCIPDINEPYICQSICTSLTYYYGTCIGGHVAKDKYKLNIKNLRWVKNRIMELYVGCLDPNSNFYMFIPDVRNFIISKYLDIVESAK